MRLSRKIRTCAIMTLCAGMMLGTAACGQDTADNIASEVETENTTEIAETTTSEPDAENDTENVTDETTESGAKESTEEAGSSGSARADL